MSEHRGERAVVLGGGMAGLLAARVLSERYREVVILDRDPIIGVEGPRRGVPQGHHAHALLARGQAILEELFPGLLAELTSAGALTCDLAGGLRWYVNGHPLAQADCGLLSVSATRPMLEAHVRNRVVALPTVQIRERVDIMALTSTPDRGRITGVTLVPQDGSGESETITADLVVDATGRGSRTPVWLEELGFQRAAEEKIKIDLVYASRFFKLDSDPFGKDLAINPVASPRNPRGAFFGKFHDGVALLSQTGVLGDHPPRDPEGFVAFAKTLSAPEIHPAIQTAEPLTDIAAFHFPASVRRRYDQLSRFPERLLVMGDAVCSFNPVYGQGMTVAAAEAAALAAHLDRGAPDPVRYFKEIAPFIKACWDISAGADLGFPGVEGKRTMQVKMGNAYMARLHTAALADGRFTRAFFRVAGLVDPPTSLMRPGLMLGVLRTARKVRATGIA
jgi:2-polyprenyl-6-methoxyphenol hydroxylase-like FAD-dependent oxidoreductase